jgi:chromosomal replication initiation ATPase DnaA
MTTPTEPMRLTVARVAAKHGVTVADIMGARRTAKISAARFEAFADCRPGRSLPRIGRFFGRHHTAVMHGIRRHEGQVSG